MAAKIGCPACARTITEGTAVCPHCSVHIPTYAPALVQDEFTLMASMSDSQRLLFQQQLTTVRKDTTIGAILAFFLGGLGVHHFYMGNILAGVIYVLFCWTFIPALLGLIEAFLMPGRVRSYNARQATRIAAQIRALETTKTPQTA